MTERQMKELLQGCSFHALLMLTSKALTRAGFGDVEILDRRSTKQKSRFGGFDMACRLTLGSLPAKVIVKVIQDDVRLRMLDEHVGAVLRSDADAGLLVTPFHLSQSVRKLQPSYKPARVEVIDGSELSQLMIRSGVGLTPSGSLDLEFFSGLEDVSEKLLAFIKANRS